MAWHGELLRSQGGQPTCSPLTLLWIPTAYTNAVATIAPNFVANAAAELVQTGDTPASRRRPRVSEQVPTIPESHWYYPKYEHFKSTNLKMNQGIFTIGWLHVGTFNKSTGSTENSASSHADMQWPFAVTSGMRIERDCVVFSPPPPSAT